MRRGKYRGYLEGIDITKPVLIYIIYKNIEGGIA
jgi:hypothetical protein